MIVEEITISYSTMMTNVKCWLTLHVVQLLQSVGRKATLMSRKYFTKAEIMRRMTDLIVRDVRVSGMENLPASGPALIVSNHPTGIADGIVMHAVLQSLRDDLFIYANHDMIRVMPQVEDLIAGVEWRQEKRSHAKTKATMDYTRDALGAGRIGLIFPSGRLAKRQGLTLHERPWMASAAMIARKFGVPVIPLRIRARNSVLFYRMEQKFLASTYMLLF